jgi:hypothetical protein
VTTDDRGNSPETFMTTGQLSDYIKVPVGTLRNWRTRKVGPPGFKAGNAVLYRRSTVDAWIEAQEAAEAERLSR